MPTEIGVCRISAGGCIAENLQVQCDTHLPFMSKLHKTTQEAHDENKEGWVDESELEM